MGIPQFSVAVRAESTNLEVVCPSCGLTVTKGSIVVVVELDDVDYYLGSPETKTHCGYPVVVPVFVRDEAEFDATLRRFQTRLAALSGAGSCMGGGITLICVEDNKPVRIEFAEEV